MRMCRQCQDTEADATTRRGKVPLCDSCYTDQLVQCHCECGHDFESDSYDGMERCPMCGSAT